MTVVASAAPSATVSATMIAIYIAITIAGSTAVPAGPTNAPVFTVTAWTTTTTALIAVVTTAIFTLDWSRSGKCFPVGLFGHEVIDPAN